MKALAAIAKLLIVLGLSLIAASACVVAAGRAYEGAASFFLPGSLYCLIALFIILASLFALDREKTAYLFGAAGCALVAPFISVAQGFMKAASLGLEVSVCPSLSVIGWWSGTIWAFLRGGDRPELLTLGFDALSVVLGLALMVATVTLSFRKGGRILAGD